MNIELVDTHCHLHWLEEAHESSVDVLMDNAQEAGVTQFLCVSISYDDLLTILGFCEHYDHVFASVGLHPNQQRDTEPTINELVDQSTHPRIIAIGETGLDYYRSTGDTEWQRDRFRTHIRAAREAELPIIVHTRQAKADTIKIMQEEGAEQIGGVMHCFTEDWPMAVQALDLGFYISFAGVVTFKNAKPLQEVAQQVPLERILIETDCPYLAPTPYRGKPNQPAYVRYVAEKIAELRGISLEEVARATTQNFFTCFPKAVST